MLEADIILSVSLSVLQKLKFPANKPSYLIDEFYRYPCRQRRQGSSYKWKICYRIVFPWHKKSNKNTYLQKMGKIIHKNTGDIKRKY